MGTISYKYLPPVKVGDPIIVDESEDIPPALWNTKATIRLIEQDPEAVGKDDEFQKTCYYVTPTAGPYPDSGFPDGGWVLGRGYFTLDTRKMLWDESMALLKRAEENPQEAAEVLTLVQQRTRETCEGHGAHGNMFCPCLNFHPAEKFVRRIIEQNK